MKIRLNLFLIVKIAFAGLIITWLIRSGHLDFSQVAKALNPSHALIISAIYMLSFLLVSERFRRLLKTQKVDLSPWEGWKLFSIGLFFNFLIPGSVGGDLVKAYYLQKEQGHQSASSPYTILLDRAIGLFCLMLVGLFSLFFNWSVVKENAPLLTTMTLLFVVLCGILGLAAAGFSKKIRHVAFHLIPEKWLRIRNVMKSFLMGFEFYAQHPITLLIALGMTFVAQFLVILAMYIASYAAGFEVPIAIFFFVVPVGIAISGLPLALPGGIGIGQAAFLVLFNMILGYESTVGPTIVTIHQIICITLSLQGLIFYLLRKKPA